MNANGKHRGGVALSEQEIDKLLSEPFDDWGHARTVLNGKPQFVHTQEMGWMSWTGTHWHSEGASYKVREAVVNALVQRRIAAVKQQYDDKAITACKPTSAHVESATKMISTLSNAVPNEFDKKPHELNCRNGVVDLRTGNLTPHDPSQRHTYCIDCDYKPEADASLWENHITKTFVPERYWNLDKANPNQVNQAQFDKYVELVAWLQLAMGYSITGESNEEIMFFVWGERRAGKGTIFQTLHTLLGRPFAQASYMSSLTRKRGGSDQKFDLAPLRSARLVTISETDAAKPFNTEVIKNLTGNDPIYCSFKGKDGFNYIPKFKIWISSNPNVKANPDDNGLWSRLKVIHCPNSFEGREDTRLKAKMLKQKNLEGVLAWLVEGARCWYKDYHNKGQKLFTPEMVLIQSNLSRKENDVLAMFIEECCQITKDDNDVIAVKDFQFDYKQWCIDNDYTPKKARSLNESMRMKGFRYADKKWGKNQITGKDVVKKCWFGVKWQVAE